MRCVTVCLCAWKDRDSEAQSEVCDRVLVCMERWRQYGIDCVHGKRQTERHRLWCVTVCLCTWNDSASVHGKTETVRQRLCAWKDRDRQ